MDALTVCDDLRRAGPARGGGRRGLRPLAAHRGARGRGGAALRADRARRRAAAGPPRHDAQHPGRGARPPRRAARADRARRGGAVQDRPRGRHAPRCGRSRPSSTRRSTSSRSCRARTSALTGTPSGFTDLDDLTGGFQPGNLIVLAARPVDGQEHAGHQHRRERRDRPRQAGRAVLARDVRDRAGAPLHRLAGEGRRATSCARAASRPTAGRRCCTRSRSWPPRRSSSTTRATSACSRCAPRRAASTPATAARADGRRLPPAGARRTTAPTAASSRSARSAAGSRSSPASSTIPVIAVSQLSRAVESRHPPSGRCSPTCVSRASIEQDADLVMFVYREEYYDQESERPARPT